MDFSFRDPLTREKVIDRRPDLSLGICDHTFESLRSESEERIFDIIREKFCDIFVDDICFVISIRLRYIRRDYDILSRLERCGSIEFRDLFVFEILVEYWKIE